MRSRDPILRDNETCTHECGHGVAAILLGARVIRIVGHRHASDGNSAGFVEYLRDHLTPWQESFVLLAGRACSEGSDVLIDRGTQDEREAMALVGAEAMGALRAAVYQWSLRRDVQAMVTALAHALADAPDMTLGGYPAKKVVHAALRPPRERTA